MDNTEKQFKSARRDEKRRKAFNAAPMGRRTPTMRFGEGLVRFEVTRKTKAPKKGK